MAAHRTRRMIPAFLHHANADLINLSGSTADALWIGWWLVKTLIDH